MNHGMESKNPQGCVSLLSYFFPPAEHTLLRMPHIFKCSFSIKREKYIERETDTVITS